MSTNVGPSTGAQNLQAASGTINVPESKFRERLVSIGQTIVHFLEDGSPVSNEKNKTLFERTATVPSKQEIARMGSENYGKFRNFFVSLGQTIVHFFGDTPPIPSTPSHSRTVKVVTNKE